MQVYYDDKDPQQVADRDKYIEYYIADLKSGKKGGESGGGGGGDAVGGGGGDVINDKAAAVDGVVGDAQIGLEMSENHLRRRPSKTRIVQGNAGVVKGGGYAILPAQKCPQPPKMQQQQQPRGHSSPSRPNHQTSNEVRGIPATSAGEASTAKRPSPSGASDRSKSSGYASAASGRNFGQCG